MAGKSGHSEGKDQAVQGTNDDAAISKLSACTAGYYSDPYLPYFVTPSHRTKRAPLINRGYYARASAVSIILHHFIDTFAAPQPAAASASAPAPAPAPAAGSVAPAAAAGAAATPAAAAPAPAPTAVTGAQGASSSSSASASSSSAAPQRPRCQVVSLGAGYDTMYFRLHAAGKAPYKYVEIDYPETARRKAHLIRSVPALTALLTPPPKTAKLRYPTAAPGDPDPLTGCHIEILSADASEWGAAAAADAAGAGAGATVLAPERGFGGYALVGADLRRLDQLTLALVAAGVDVTLPTLFLSECVLVYLQPHESEQIVRWAASVFGGAGRGGALFVCYEQILPWDAFGQQMMKNLSGRGCALLSLESVPDLNAHCARYLRCGWSMAAAWDMNDIYRHFLPPADVARIEQLEMFDEFEEWHIIQGHYHISMAALVPGLPPAAAASHAASHAAAPAPAAGASSSSSTAAAAAAAAGTVAPSTAAADAARAAAISASPLSRIGLLGRAKTPPAGAAGGAVQPAYMGTEAGPMVAAAAAAAAQSGGAIVDPIASKLAVIEAYKRRQAALKGAPAPAPNANAPATNSVAAAAGGAAAVAPKPGPVRGSNK